MLGERIKMLRNEKGLTMKQMAETFNLSISAWNKYEKNEAEPNISNLIKMADYFGFPWIFYWEEQILEIPI